MFPGNQYRERKMAVAMRAGPLRGTQAVEAGGAATESMGGVATIVLTILALCGVLPRVLTSIGGIVFGIAFMVEGAAIAARQTGIMSQASGATDSVETGSGASVELMGGLAAIVLGILALVGVVPAILLSALVVVGGVALILSAGTVQRLNELHASLSSPDAGPQAQSVANLAASNASSGQFLAGIAAAVLGILGLVGIYPIILSAVGLLVLGAAITFSGTALAGRLLKIFKRE